MIAGEYQHVIWVIALDECHVLEDRVRGSGIPPLARAADIWGEHIDSAVVPVKIPGLSGANIGVQLKRLILGEHADGVYC